jgi:hypothetical protein
MRLTGPTRDTSADFSGSPNGCSMAGNLKGLSQFHQSLRRDGYQVDEQTGQITPAGPQLSVELIARLADPSAVREGFERIRRAIPRSRSAAQRN